MVETIKLSELSKDYINNHVVNCNGIQCVYRELINAYSGRTKKRYVVLDKYFTIEFKTIKELKNYIKEEQREN